MSAPESLPAPAPEDAPGAPVPARPTRRRRARQVLLALVVLALAVVGAELAARRWYPVGGQNYRLDDQLLFTTVPGSRRLQFLPEGADHRRVLVTVGPDGFRGAALESPRTRPRVLVLGDSLVFAGNAPDDETFVVRLAEQLAGRAGLDDGVEAVNAGLEGYGPDQALLKFVREADVLEPDLVLFVLCAHNDFGDLMRGKLFRLGPREALEPCTPVVGPHLRAHFRQRERELERPVLWRLVQRALDPPAPVELARGDDLVPLYLQADQAQYLEHVELRDPVVEDVQRDTWDAQMALEPDSRGARYKRRLMVRVLARLRLECERRRVPVAVVVVPSGQDLDPDFLIRPDPARFPEYDEDRLARLHAECAREAGLPVLDLTEVLRAHPPADMFVGGDDFHWSCRGQARGAEAIAAWLEARGLLDLPAPGAPR